MCRSIASFRLFLSRSAAAVCCATIAQSALALPSTSKVERVASITVRLSDLDLHNDADVQVLLGRLQRAAFKACGGEPRWHPSYVLMPRHTVAVFEQCRRDAVARAVAAIGVPKLARALSVTVAEVGT
jgi:UrcA family protein